MIQIGVGLLFGGQVGGVTVQDGVGVKVCARKGEPASSARKHASAPIIENAGDNCKEVKTDAIWQAVFCLRKLSHPLFLEIG